VSCRANVQTVADVSVIRLVITCRQQRVSGYAADADSAVEYLSEKLAQLGHHCWPTWTRLTDARPDTCHVDDVDVG